MKAEDRLADCNADETRVKLWGSCDCAACVNKATAREAIALLREFPPIDDKTPVATWMRLCGDWDKRRKALLEGGDEASSD